MERLLEKHAPTARGMAHRTTTTSAYPFYSWALGFGRVSIPARLRPRTLRLRWLHFAGLPSRREMGMSWGKRSRCCPRLKREKSNLLQFMPKRSRRHAISSTGLMGVARFWAGSARLHDIL